jgi:hypothetical protein
VPEITVHEDRKPSASENEVWPAEYSCVVLTKTETDRLERDCQTLFGFSLHRPDGAHDTTPRFPIEHVGHLSASTPSLGKNGDAKRCGVSGKHYAAAS